MKSMLWNFWKLSITKILRSNIAEKQEIPTSRVVYWCLLSHHLMLFRAALLEPLKLRKAVIWQIAALAGGLSSIPGKNRGLPTLTFTVAGPVLPAPLAVCGPSLGHLCLSRKAQSMCQSPVNAQSVSEWIEMRERRAPTPVPAPHEDFRMERVIACPGTPSCPVLSSLPTHTTLLDTRKGRLYSVLMGMCNGASPAGSEESLRGIPLVLLDAC